MEREKETTKCPGRYTVPVDVDVSVCRTVMDSADSVRGLSVAVGELGTAHSPVSGGEGIREKRLTGLLLMPAWEGGGGGQ